MAMGRIVICWDERSYGFIECDDGGPDLFFHYSGLPPGRYPMPNERVEFTIIDGRKGKSQAADVRFIRS